MDSEQRADALPFAGQIRLAGIRQAAEGEYVVTMAYPDGSERDFTFRLAPGAIEVVEPSLEFAREFGSYGQSPLIDRAVHTFHEACKQLYGRPYPAGPADA